MFSLNLKWLVVSVAGLRNNTVVNSKNQAEDTILSVCHVPTDVHGENSKQTLVSPSI